MTSKATSILDNTVRSFARTALPDAHGISGEVRGESLGDAPMPSLISERANRRPDDYHIALVPRQERTSSTEVLQPSAIPRVFLLPLTWQELLARMRDELKSTPSASSAKCSRFGDVRVDFLAMQVTRFDQPVVLTAQQFKLLKFLMQKPERVFSRDELLEEVWGYNHYPSTRTVDNHICSLRRKLELNPARPIHFLTVRRMGYKFIP